jgi:hypothetical protein
MEKNYRAQIDGFFERYFDIDREVQSTCGKAIDYVLRCRKSGLLLGVEVKRIDNHKTGATYTAYLKQAGEYAKMRFLTRFSNEPQKVLVFITPSLSHYFKEVMPGSKRVIDGVEYFQAYHSDDNTHSNINGIIGGLLHVGEIRSMGQKVAFVFRNWVIWSAINGRGVSFSKEKYQRYVES